MKPPDIILASRSARRKLLLKQIGMKFRVHASRVVERVEADSSPAKNVLRIAREKANDVSKHHRRGIIVAADTIVVLKKKMLGKPSSKEDARRMLRSLSGKPHRVYTGFAIVDSSTGKTSVGYERTTVWFRKLDEREIVSYVDSGSPMDKAGAYGIQDDYGAVFVEKVHGCFYNVVGFPLPKFYAAYRKFVKQLNNK